MTKYIDKQINVKFNGGRESTLFPLHWQFPSFLIERKVVGTLKGYDQLMNLVLDDVKETMRGKWLPLNTGST